MKRRVSNFHPMRLLTLQIKTGYIQEPYEYKFLRRYPPMTRDTRPPRFKIVARKIPYLNLYESAIARNPLYFEERLYPAFNQQEPSALILAKKQYDLMQEGLDEETAYVQAQDYVLALESKAYEDLHDLRKTLSTEGAQVPFVSDPSVISEMTKWRSKLAVKPYGEMDLADLGEIDYFIQKKILKWDEAQRARRMKDPIIVREFEGLREALFPEIVREKEQKSLLPESRKTYRERSFLALDIDPTLVYPENHFLYTDYKKYFEKCKAEPMLNKWPYEESNALTNWIKRTLGSGHVKHAADPDEYNMYLDILKFKYFPMLRLPKHLFKSLQLPEVKDFKALLFKNKINYRDAGGKVYVRRFYLLPKLLFPKETFIVSLIADNEKLREMRGSRITATPSSQPGVASSDESLSAVVENSVEPEKSPSKKAVHNEFDVNLRKEMKEWDIAEKHFNEIKSQLETYMRSATFRKDDPDDPDVVEETYSSSSIWSSINSEQRSDRFSPLDALLNEGSSDNKYSDLISQSFRDENESDKDLFKIDGVDIHDHVSLDDEAFTDIKPITILGEEEEEDNIFGNDDPEYFAFSNKHGKTGRTIDSVSKEEWQKIVKKHVKSSDTLPLEIEREKYIRDEYFLELVTVPKPEEATTEMELLGIGQDRLNNRVIEQGRLAVDFERKDAARRLRDWKRRGVIAGGKPTLGDF